MSNSILLAVHPRQWQLVRVEGQKAETREIVVDGNEVAAVAGVLKEWNATRAPLCLGLPPEWLLTASIDCGDLPRKDRQAAMLYRLEEQLPLDIEVMTAEFFPHVGGKALGVAVETLVVKKLVAALAEAGIEPRAICSTTLLALWTASLASPPCEYALVAMDGTVDVFLMRDKNPCAWYTATDSADDIVRCIEAHRLHSPDDSDRQLCMVVAGADWQGQGVLDRLDLEARRDSDVAPLLQAAQAAAGLLAGREAGWIDFRKALGPVGRMGIGSASLRWAVVLGLLLPLVFSAAMVWRGLQYTGQIDIARQEQVDTYQKLYPNTPVPRLIRDRLQSDLRRFGGISGMGQQVPQQVDALNTLAQVCRAMPTSMRWLILNMRIDPDNILIEGQARLHSDAEAINRSLADASLDMDPPRTQSIAGGGGVSFTLSGSPRAPGKEPAAPAKQPPASSATAGDSGLNGQVPK